MPDSLGSHNFPRASQQTIAGPQLLVTWGPTLLWYWEEQLTRVSLFCRFDSRLVTSFYSSQQRAVAILDASRLAHTSQHWNVC